MEIVRSDWIEVPSNLSAQTLKDFYQRVLEKAEDDRFYYQISETEVINAARASKKILERLNLISTSIAASQDYNNSIFQDLHGDLRLKTEGLKTFYTDFIRFQQNLSSYLENMWKHDFAKQDAIIIELRLNIAQAQKQHEEVMKGLNVLYERPSQADIDAPFIRSHLTQIEKVVEAIDARIIEESQQRQDQDKEIKEYISKIHDSLANHSTKVAEVMYEKSKRDYRFFKEEVLNRINRQKDHSESLDRIEKRLEQKQVVTCKFREIPPLEIKEGKPISRRVINDGLDKTHKIASPVPNIGQHNLMIQRLRDSSSNVRTWWKERNFTNPLQWKEWGEVDWKIVEDSINNGQLPEIRYVDLFKEGAIPKTPNYNMTYHCRNHVLQKGYTELQVFDSEWLRSRGTNRNFQFLTFGLFQARIQGLHRPQNNINIMCCLVDKRWKDFEKSLIGIAQLEMSDNIGYFNVIPAFTVTVDTAKHFKLILYASGYEDYIIPDANINIEFQSYVKFSQFPHQGMQDGIPSGRLNEEILVRTNSSDYNHTYSIKNTGPMREKAKTIWHLPEFQETKTVQNKPLFINQDDVTGNVTIQFGPPKTTVKNLHNEENRFRNLGETILSNPSEGECSSQANARLLRQASCSRPRRSFDQKDLVREKARIQNFGQEPSELDMKTFKEQMKKSHSVRFGIISQDSIVKLRESKNTKELLRKLRLIEEEGEQRLMPATAVGPGFTKQEVGSSSRPNETPKLFSKPIGINIPIYSNTPIKTKPDYIKDLPTSDKSFTPVKTMATQAINQ